LKSINSAAFAWIKVQGTRVDYPVVQSPYGNNDYYLDHGLDRTYNVSGAIFTDFNNKKDLSKNRNTCVYGHNMNDGTMFQTIMNFKTKNQFKNGQIEIYTVEGIYIYEPFSVYEAIPTERFFHTEFLSDEDFEGFLSEIKEKSVFKSDVSLDKNDKIVTLITCTNGVVDKRFVVHAVLKETVK
jgi:sortase B